MKKGHRLMRVGLLGLAIVVLLAGCSGTEMPQSVATNSGPAASETDEVPVVSQADDVVIAGAVIEPAHWSELYFNTVGQVTEVLVAPGDQIAAGAVLLRLDTGELELSLQSAQQDIIVQKAALAQLINGVSEAVVARAAKGNAQQAAQAEIALQVNQLQLEKARAEDPTADAAAAQANIEQLQLQLAQARARDPTPDVTAAQVELTRAQIALEDAQIEYNEALDRPWEPQEVRDGYAKALRQAELNYELAQSQLESALDAQEAHGISLKVLMAQIDEAKDQLAQAIAAQETYTVTLNILAAEVEAANLELEALQTWENPYLDEASDEEVAQAEAHLRQAELAAARLELQMQDAELRAPFAGTVVDVHVETGDRVSPGGVVVVLATLNQLWARTTDLTELSVARVAVGQRAMVSVDALPGREFAGVVREIALQARDYRGDVVYDVTIELTDPESAEALRWGMTALAKIETR